MKSRSSHLLASAAAQRDVRFELAYGLAEFGSQEIPRRLTRRHEDPHRVSVLPLPYAPSRDSAETSARGARLTMPRSDCVSTNSIKCCASAERTMARIASIACVTLCPERYSSL